MHTQTGSACHKLYRYALNVIWGIADLKMGLAVRGANQQPHASNFRWLETKGEPLSVSICQQTLPMDILSSLVLPEKLIHVSKMFTFVSDCKPNSPSPALDLTLAKTERGWIKQSFWCILAAGRVL